MDVTDPLIRIEVNSKFNNPEICGWNPEYNRIIALQLSHGAGLKKNSIDWGEHEEIFDIRQIDEMQQLFIFQSVLQ